MRPVPVVLVDIIVGGIVFWSPSVLWHAFRTRNFSGIDVIVLTVFLPIVAIVCFEILWRLQSKVASRQLVARLIILGIWLFGPLFMRIGWNYTGGGGGSTDPDNLSSVITSIVLFPVYTFLMSGYDGTLMAVLMTTLLLILIQKRKRASHSEK